MISKRYYLTVLSLMPILLAYAWFAVWTFRRTRGSRWRASLWSLGVFVITLLFLTSGLAESRASRWIARSITVSAETFVNLSGLLGAASLGIYFLFRFISSCLPVSFRQDRRIALRAIAGAGMAAPLAVAGYGVFVERTNLEICETPIGIRDLPSDLDGFQIVQISDIHLSPYLSVKTLGKVIDSANELKGDIVFITGDLISAKGDPLDDCLAQLARLNQNTPRLGCLGNHEIYANAVEYTVRHGAAVGIDFLRDRSRVVRVGDAVLNVAGVDYQPIGQRAKYLRHGRSMICPGAVNLLLSHNPDVFPVAAEQGYDVTLSGHMHGGQITFELLSPALNPARMLTPFVRGLYREGDRSCYVTRGIGTLGVPARLGSRPEITLLTLKRI